MAVVSSHNFRIRTPVYSCTEIIEELVLNGAKDQEELDICKGEFIVRVIVIIRK